jgi:hypothetical protein
VVGVSTCKDGGAVNLFIRTEDTPYPVRNLPAAPATSSRMDHFHGSHRTLYGRLDFGFPGRLNNQNVVRRVRVGPRQKSLCNP